MKDTALNQYYWKDEEVAAYHAELKRKRDEQAVYAQREDEGEARGFAKGKSEGQAEGFAKGEAEGAAREALRIARQLLSLGVSMEDIQKATRLTAEEIIALHTSPYT